WGEYHDPFQIALAASAWLPTAAADAFVGTGRVRMQPQVILGGNIRERLVWSSAFGLHWQDNTTYGGVAQGMMFKWGAGAGVLLLDNRRLQLGGEASGAVTLRDSSKYNLNAELLFGARYRVVDDLELGIGAGPGLTAGIGTPNARGVFSITYT